MDQAADSDMSPHPKCLSVYNYTMAEINKKIYSSIPIVDTIAKEAERTFCRSHFSRHKNVKGAVQSVLRMCLVRTLTKEF